MHPLKAVMFVVGISAPCIAGDFDSVINTVRQTWPERRTVVVICNKDASSMALMDLGSATEKIISLLVVDIAAPKNFEKVIGAVTRKPRNEIFVLLIPDDPVTGEDTDTGRALVSRMIARGIPVVGTTPNSIKLGAVFAQGAGTGDKVLSNPEAAKKLSVTLPAPTTP